MWRSKSRLRGNKRPKISATGKKIPMVKKNPNNRFTFPTDSAPTGSKNNK